MSPLVVWLTLAGVAVGEGLVEELLEVTGVFTVVYQLGLGLFAVREAIELGCLYLLILQIILNMALSLPNQYSRTTDASSAT